MNDPFNHPDTTARALAQREDAKSLRRCLWVIGRRLGWIALALWFAAAALWLKRLH